MAQAEGRRRESTRLAAALPFAVFALLALVSWNRWLEPYVDSGRELMVPWRVSQGERLYADVEFHHGPLAPFLGAASDRLFGRSLAAREALAAAIALLHVAALALLARRMLTAGRAALAVSVAVAAAVFLIPGGWLFPFSFDAAIAVAALTWALELAARRTRLSDALAGACLAGALLARLEMGLAAVAVFVLAHRGEPRRLRSLALAPLAAAALGYAAVSAGIPLRTLEADGWMRLIDPPEAFRNVYRAYAGLDRPALRLTELLLAAVVLTLVAAWLAAAAAASTRLSSRRGPAGRAIEIAALAGLGLVAFLRLRPPGRLAETAALFPPLVRVVPLVVAAAALWRLILRARGRAPRGPLAAVPDGVLWIAALFGARLLLAAGYVGPYDAFFLPLPLLVAGVGFFGLADRAARSLGPPAARLATAGLALFLLFRIAALADLYRRPGWSRVETPVGPVVLREPAAASTRLALADLEGRLAPEATLAGFPETGFFNYVLGRRNPFRHEQYFPGHLEAGADSRFAATFAARPPDVTLFANVLAVGEGARVFGEDYLEALDRSVRSETRAAASYGPGAREGARIGDPHFFVEIRLPAVSSGGGRIAPPKSPAGGGHMARPATPAAAETSP
jgi:hypothetical protein